MFVFKKFLADFFSQFLNGRGKTSTNVTNECKTDRLPRIASLSQTMLAVSLNESFASFISCDLADLQFLPGPCLQEARLIYLALAPHAAHVYRKNSSPCN